MASVRDMGARLDDLIARGAIKAHIMRLPEISGDRNLAITFSGVRPDEARMLLDASIRIEQMRTGDVLSPTDYRNRFSGLDLDEAN